LMTERERTDETNLLYVAVTRARETLVLNGLLQMLMEKGDEDEDVVDTGDSAC
ncbi:DNA helicase, partial [Serratia sp. CY85251]